MTDTEFIVTATYALVGAVVVMITLTIVIMRTVCSEKGQSK